jgi:nickel/cobalt exporter
MALGTAITVSALAALTVGSRNLAMTLAGSDSHWGATVARAASITSAVTVFVVGAVSFVASFHSTRPF